MSFGNRVLQFRKSKKVSQIALAKLAGIHPTMLGRYERDETNPTIEMANKLANALDISLDYLIGNIEAKLDQDLIDKIIVMQNLPEEDQKCINYALDGLIQHALNRKAYLS